MISVFNVIVSWNKNNLLSIQCSSLREELYLANCIPHEELHKDVAVKKTVLGTGLQGF